MNPLVPDFILHQDALGRAEGSFSGAALRIELPGLIELAEALMPHGGAGAEELARFLQACFDPLIEAVHDAGGFVATLAGDGLTAMFPDAPERDVAERALAAALSMRDRLAERPERQTPFGTFPFSFRMGIAWGAVEWGIVRISPERAYYHFHGQALSACAAAERQAHEGEIFVDGALVERIRPGSAERRGDGVSWLGDLPAPGRPPVPRSPPPGDGAAFAGGGAAGVRPGGRFCEVTTVSVSFEQIPGFAELTRLLHELSEVYGGTFTGVQASGLGVAALIHFGAPIAREDDNERALDFALALKSRAQRRMRLRAGVARGVRYVGVAGGAERRGLACLGRATKLAARLAEQARWSSIWADAQAFLASEAGYRWTMEDLFRFEGFGAPTLVYALERRRVSVHKQFHDLGLLGREADLDLLSRQVEPIFDGKPAGLVYIEGEPGIGKSYLVQRLRERCEAHQRGRPFLWIDARCDATSRGSLNALEFALRERFRASPALGKEERIARFDEAFDRLLDRIPEGQRALRRELDRARSLLAALVGIRSEDSTYERMAPEFRYKCTLSALGTLFLAEASLQPVILHLEDAHWADEGSLEAVGAIARACTELPVAILCATRRKDDGSSVRISLGTSLSKRRLELKQLSQEQRRALAASFFQDAIPHALEAKLLAAGGNPLFAQELLAEHLADARDTSSFTSRSSSGLDWHMPARTGHMPAGTAESLLIARIERLDAKVQRTIVAAAVLGREFELRVLAQMLSDAPVMEEHLRIGEAECIWSALDERRFQFSSALLRGAAYEMQRDKMPWRVWLRERHRLAAEAIELVHGDDLDGHLAALGEHCSRAGEEERARRYFLAGARRAAARYDLEEAARLYRSYFALSPDPTRESVAVLQEFARDVLKARKRHGEARQEHLRAVADAQPLGGRASEARGFLDLGRACWAKQQPDDARTYWEEGLRAAREAGDLAAEGYAVACLGMAHAAEGRVDAARAMYLRAIEIAGRTGKRTEETRLLSELANLNRLSELPAGAAAMEQQAAAIEREPTSGDRRV